MLQDLAYARSLAEEGRHAPLIGGSFLVLFGVLLAICNGAHWAIYTGRTPMEPPMVGAVWLAFGIVAPLASMLLSRRVRKLPGGSAVANRVDRIVWNAVAAAILFVAAGALLRMIFTGDYTAPNAIIAAGFGLYGVALYVTAAIGGHGWLKGIALMAWAVSGVLWFFIDQTWLYLIAAGASVAVLVVPGVIMMRREPSMLV